MEVDSIEGVKLDKEGGFKYMILSDIITRDGRLTTAWLSQHKAAQVDSDKGVMPL